jgi:NADPH2 dehydrogenase
LWALGRVALPEVARLEGFDVVSSNPNPLDSDNPPSREGTKEEIQGFIQDYAQAARNALQAGFDGVEVHGAGGCLIDQFTKDNCNTRTDEHAGSIENGSRFILEVVRAVADVVGSNRVGVRLSPWQRYQGLRMEDPVPQFTHVIGKRRRLTLAYLHLRRPSVLIDDSSDTDPIDPFIEAWGDCAPVILRFQTGIGKVGPRRPHQKQGPPSRLWSLFHLLDGSPSGRNGLFDYSILRIELVV